MRTLAFDGRTGASGDMLLGALIAAGADPTVLEPVEAATDVTYEVTTTSKQGVSATDVTVRLEGDPSGRPYEAVVDRITGIGVPPGVEEDALATVDLLAAAEAAVHGTDPVETHFHEVGADDAVADVVGAALLVADLDVDRVVTTPVAAGGGETTFSHGTYPVPTPAVLELAERADWDLSGGPADRELLTPTGAAVLAHYADGVETLPPMRVDASGHGAGDASLGDRPNVLRALVGTARGRLDREGVVVLETNLDDAAPEVLGGLQERLSAAGALDVSVVPLTMKKSRPGHLVKVVTAAADADRVARRLAAETGTLGVREVPVSHRWAADRHFETVTVEAGGERHELTVKVATDEAGEVLDASAEYEDAAAVAEAADVPVRTVLARAEAAYRAQGDAGDDAD